MALLLYKKQLFQLLPLFSIMVFVGTLHHETGHYIAAKWMRLSASIHYNYTHVDTVTGKQLTRKQLFWFIIAGPLQTMLTGTIALITLRFLNRRRQLSTFSRNLLILVALFWVRQPVNLALYLLRYVSTGHYSEKGDEAKLSFYFQWPVWSLNVSTAVVGLLIIATIIFRFVPVQRRFTFWLAGSIGGAVGFYLWMIWLGKYILP